MQITRQTIQYATEAEWLAARNLDVTSTEASALLGASPYMTEFELHHIKAGTLAANDFAANDRMKWGNRLESAIAEGIAEDYGLIVEPFKVYVRVPELRMGSSFDYKVVGLVEGFSGDETAREMFRKFGPGILEIKNVDGLQFKRGWIEDGEQIEAPPHIEIQVQHQMFVADMAWSMIAPLVGGNTPKLVIRERDYEIGQVIVQKAIEFWSRVNSGTPPKPDFLEDADTISRLYVDNDGSSADLSGNTDLIEACIAYKAAAAEAKSAEDRKKAARAEILAIIRATKTIQAGGFKISAGTNKESYRAYRREAGERISITISKIPAADIEATVPAYRNVRITGEAA